MHFQYFHWNSEFYMGFRGFPVLDGNSIDLALVFIRVGAKCGNDGFRVEIVARGLVFTLFLWNIQQFLTFYIILRGFHEKTHLKTYAVANDFQCDYQTTARFFKQPQ